MKIKYKLIWNKAMWNKLYLQYDYIYNVNVFGLTVLLSLCNIRTLPNQWLVFRFLAVLYEKFKPLDQAYQQHFG